LFAPLMLIAATMLIVATERFALLLCRRCHTPPSMMANGQSNATSLPPSRHYAVAAALLAEDFSS
jgi:hypothetical protein